MKVCKRWKKFQMFSSDLGVSPPGLYLDRINNNKGYKPSNCRWITSKKSAANRRVKFNTL